MNGKVVALSCGVYSVESDGVIYRVSARGIFRNRCVKPMVGDDVDIDEQNLVLNEVKPRKSELKRPPIANIDQLLIIQSLKEPDFSHLLTFKYLTYANMNGIKAKIILTKSDKVIEDNYIKDIVEVYKKLGIETYIVSSKTQEGLEKIRGLFCDHITCLMGQSGVGKSSLINAIDPSFMRMVGDYSIALGRGKHQTKEVILLPYEGGYIADTPGFSSLDLGVYKEDLAKYFPGFTERSLKCYYSNCLHISEKNCEIKAALASGEIPQEAYDCYLKLSNDAIFKAKRYD